jgi:hypothetical protein
MEASLSMALGSAVPEKYDDFFLAAYGYYDEMYKLVEVSDSEFVNTFSKSMGNLSNTVTGVDKQAYSSSFQKFVKTHMEQNFEKISDKQLEVMGLGAQMVSNPMGGMALTSHFMRP